MGCPPSFRLFSSSTTLQVSPAGWVVQQSARWRGFLFEFPFPCPSSRLGLYEWILVNVRAQAVGRIIKGVLYVLDLFIILIIFNSNVSGMWISMSSGMAISFIAFGSYIRAMLDAVILLFYIRPFAVGDIVQISDTIDGALLAEFQIYFVSGIRGRTTTSFRRAVRWCTARVNVL